jgi:hypothetical protein
METENTQQIVDEILELSKQYLAEVPSKRRTWPKSIKERVLQLLQLEWSSEQIAVQTRIPAPTVYSWKARCQTDAGFLPVQILPEKSLPIREVFPKKRNRKNKTPLAIIVISPRGIRFEGLDLEASLKVAREIESWG